MTPLIKCDFNSRINAQYMTNHCIVAEGRNGVLNTQIRGVLEKKRTAVNKTLFRFEIKHYSFPLQYSLPQVYYTFPFFSFMHLLIPGRIRLRSPSVLRSQSF